MRKIITAFLNYFSFSFSFLFRLFFHLKTAWHLDTLKGAKGFGQKTKGEIPPFDPCLYVLLSQTSMHKLCYFLSFFFYFPFILFDL